MFCDLSQIGNVPPRSPLFSISDMNWELYVTKNQQLKLTIAWFR